MTGPAANVARSRSGAARIAAAAILVIAAGLGACVERGDFGRVKPSVWNDALAATGTLSALGRGEAVSPNALTDDEEEMRGRAWRFLVPTHERAWFERVLAELVATRIAPPEPFDEDPSAYYRTLRSEGARSPASLYRQLSEDGSADTHLLGPFAGVAQRVLAADRVRLRSLAYVRDLSPADIADARARVVENRCLFAWVESGLQVRMRSYRYALEHLVIATPQTDAVPAEQALARLGQHRAVLDRLGVPAIVTACAPAEAGPEAADLRPAPPPIRKG